jgi:excisionase family DNA binding protein
LKGALMEISSKVLNSEEAARVLGVNVSSIKRWTDEGKLECIRTIGGHRKFQMQHLASFVKRNKKIMSKINIFTIENTEDLEINYYILKGDFEYLTVYLIEKAILGKRDEVQNVLTGLHLSQYPLYQIYDQLITPVLHQIGNQWTEQALTITEEHIASQIIRDAIIRLQGIIRVPRNKIGQVICLNLSSELHDIALKMVQNLLELRGFQTYFTGQKTPYLDLERMLLKIQPDRLYISSTYNEDERLAQLEVEKIYELCGKAKIKVFIGGRAFDHIKFDNQIIPVRLMTFQDVYES